MLEAFKSLLEAHEGPYWGPTETMETYGGPLEVYGGLLEAY